MRSFLLIPALVTALLGLAPAAEAQSAPSAAICPSPSHGLVYVGDASAPPLEFIDKDGKPAA